MHFTTSVLATFIGVSLLALVWLAADLWRVEKAQTGWSFELSPQTEICYEVWTVKATGWTLATKTMAPVDISFCGQDQIVGVSQR